MKRAVRNFRRWLVRDPWTAIWAGLVIGCILWMIFSKPKPRLTPDQQHDQDNYLNSQGRFGY